MTSRWSWLALGLGAYLAFTLASFPAATALRWWAPPGVVLTGVEGTVWSGTAASCAVNGFTAEGLRWRIAAWPLFIGRISASVEARIPDGFLATRITASPSRLRFNELRGATSLPGLAAVLPVRGMRGQISVALDLLEIEAGWPSSVVGSVKLAGLETAPFIPDGSGALLALGDYTVTFVPAPQRALAAEFVDNGGPLEVMGSIDIDSARVYSLDALIEPRPGAPESLVQGLRIMTAEPDAEGRRRLSLTGSL